MSGINPEAQPNFRLPPLNSMRERISATAALLAITGVAAAAGPAAIASAQEQNSQTPTPTGEEACQKKDEMVARPEIRHGKRLMFLDRECAIYEMQQKYPNYSGELSPTEEDVSYDYDLFTKNKKVDELGDQKFQWISSRKIKVTIERYRNKSRGNSTLAIFRPIGSTNFNDQERVEHSYDNRAIYTQGVETRLMLVSNNGGKPKRFSKITPINKWNKPEEADPLIMSSSELTEEKLQETRTGVAIIKLSRTLSKKERARAYVETARTYFNNDTGKPGSVRYAWSYRAPDKVNVYREGQPNREGKLPRKGDIINTSQNRGNR